MYNEELPTSVGSVAADFKIDFLSQDVSCRSRAIAIEENFSKEKLK